MTHRRSRAGTVAAALVLALSFAGAMLVGPGVTDRLRHPSRYAISGHALLAPAAYLAARPRGGREGVSRLTLPARDGPVIVSAPDIDIYLDTPTARVLGIAHTRPSGRAGPIVGAQPVERVIARARPYGGGGPLRSVEWPTARSPDWTVRFGDAVAAVKVADDSGTARAAPARVPDGTAAWASRPGLDALAFPARVTILLTAIATGIAAAVTLVRLRAAARSSGRALAQSTVPAARAPGPTAAPASPRSAARRGGRGRRWP